MKIVIAGAGEVGTHLAKLLSKEGLDIILIDNDENKLHAIDANYNLMTMTGSPTAFKVLKKCQSRQMRPVYRRNAIRDAQHRVVLVCQETRSTENGGTHRQL